jgi:hypothetical protein
MLMSIPDPTMPGMLCGFGPIPSPVCHRPRAVLRQPKAMRGEIAVDATAKLFLL